MPAVNLDLMYQAMLRETKARANQMLYWSRLLDWKNQTLTPNTDVIYLTPYFDTKEVGPVVLEIPPADGGVINGTIMDAWQMPLEDVGPAGVDGGKGGKYVVLPPGYTQKVPAGYIALPSETYKGYALLRSILKSGSDADLQRAVAYGKRIKVYPLSQAAKPPPTTYVDADGVLYDATIPYDASFYAMLDRIVQTEPWLPRDRAMIDTLKTIGIEKGKPYAPDAGMRKTLDEAAARAHTLLDARFSEIFETSWAEGSRWAFPARRVRRGRPVALRQSGRLPDRRSRPALRLHLLHAQAPGRGPVLPDGDRRQERRGARRLQELSPQRAGERTGPPVLVGHRLRPPPPRADPRSAPRRPLLQSPGLQTNADGTVDLYFGPKAPAGKEANWVPTRADGKFEALVRFYGPKPALFDKTWVLPDIEE